MQARRQTQELSAATSLKLVKTMLSAGFSCIARERDLFPEDNFEQCHLVGHDPSKPTTSAFSSQSSQKSSSRSTSGMRVTMVRRGHTPEADKLLDYLELGVFDALEKRYLRSFIFALYLDKQRPNNIVEAYTFNFSYLTIPGTDLTIPVLSLGDKMENLSLGKSIQASDLGRPATLDDAKQSVKKLLRRLMHTVPSLDNLPNQRYATFKLFYTEDTPDSYEPPYFNTGDFDKDRFIFKTHSPLEKPERFNIGAANVGHHAVDIKIASIACFLPGTENRTATYDGVTSSTSAVEPSRTPELAMLRRGEEHRLQQKDAQVRNTEWSADDDSSALRRLTSEDDAEGEVDPDYTALYNHPIETDTTRKGVVLDDYIPSSVTNDICESHPLEATQVVDSQAFSELADSIAISSMESGGINTMEVKKALGFPSSSPDNMNILITDTQIPNTSFATTTSDDPIASFSKSVSISETSKTKDYQNSAMQQAGEQESIRTGCNCSISINDDQVMCDGICKRWFHIWCMGYHSIEDPRLPAKFLCLDCRLKNDPNYDKIKDHHALLQEICSKFRELCLFRRSLKCAEKIKPKTFINFKGALGCDGDVADQMWKRLEREGFIEPMTSERVTRKNVKNGKQLMRTYRAVALMFKSDKMVHYFSPNTQVEYSLVGLTKSYPPSERVQFPLRQAKVMEHPADSKARETSQGFEVDKDHQFKDSESLSTSLGPQTPCTQVGRLLNPSSSPGIGTARHSLRSGPPTNKVQHSKRKMGEASENCIYKRVKISLAEGIDLEP